MVKCKCGAVGIIRTSGTKRNPGRPFYACPLQGPRSGFISWVDEENHTYEAESQNLELEIHNEELQIQNRDLEIQNEELEIQNRNLKMLLIVTVFCALETVFPLIISSFSVADFLLFFFGLPIGTRCFGGNKVVGQGDLNHILLPFIGSNLKEYMFLQVDSQ
ncbi:uncharacterized protein LOC128132364 [Lactuca sativa]|uniref:uncharacterized protein LOC128132364 n=1 Tax=Lactuca sativa TaxID=4236 RepID=UPI0022AEB292|nr:uncharacterized protein LOC128132364 [Lactuca sativa]